MCVCVCVCVCFCPFFPSLMCTRTRQACSIFFTTTETNAISFATGDSSGCLCWDQPCAAELAPSDDPTLVVYTMVSYQQMYETVGGVGGSSPTTTLTICLDYVQATYDQAMTTCSQLKGKQKKICKLKARGDRYTGSATCYISDSLA